MFDYFRDLPPFQVQKSQSYGFYEKTHTKQRKSKSLCRNVMKMTKNALLEEKSPFYCELIDALDEHSTKRTSVADIEHFIAKNLHMIKRNQHFQEKHQALFNHAESAKYLKAEQKIASEAHAKFDVKLLEQALNTQKINLLTKERLINIARINK